MPRWTRCQSGTRCTPSSCWRCWRRRSRSGWRPGTTPLCARFRRCAHTWMTGWIPAVRLMTIATVHPHGARRRRPAQHGDRRSRRGAADAAQRELHRHGFEGVEIAFDAPAKEWSGKLTGPTVDLFLYDLREALDRAQASRRANGATTAWPVIIDPPLQPGADLRRHRLDQGGRGRAPTALAGARDPLLLLGGARTT